MHKRDLALNSPQWLIYHKTKPNKKVSFGYIENLYKARIVRLKIIVKLLSAEDIRLMVYSKIELSSKYPPYGA